MLKRGRPRITPEEYQARVARYCQAHGVELPAEGPPAYPSGKRETAQHREWMLLYKAHQRLTRRVAGQCVRCAALASDGSVFCEEHRASVSAVAAAHGASLADRQRLLKAQAGACPICGREVGLWDSVDHSHETGALRALLHQRCNQIVGFAEAEGPEALERLTAYLWPGAGPTLPLRVDPVAPRASGRRKRQKDVAD